MSATRTCPGCSTASALRFSPPPRASSSIAMPGSRSSVASSSAPSGDLMSRIGKVPVKVPEKVKIDVAFNKGVKVEVKGGEVIVTRPDDTTASKSLHGLTRTIIANAVHGVTTGWEQALEINGVGFKAEPKGKKFIFTLGFSHPIAFEPPTGITLDIQKE